MMRYAATERGTFVSSCETIKQLRRNERSLGVSASWRESDRNLDPASEAIMGPRVSMTVLSSQAATRQQAAARVRVRTVRG